MRGEIVAFDADAGTGEIAGDDFARYSFRGEDARSPALLRVGARVDFTATEDRRAMGIGVLVKNLATPVDDRKRFDIGRVIQRTFSAIGRNWAVFLAGSAVLVGAPSLLMSSGQADLMLIGNGTISPASALGTFGLGLLLYLAGYYLLQGMMLKAAVNGFSGKSTPLSAAFNVGLRNALPLFALAILAGLGVAIGFLFLIVPGVFLMVLWIVTAPTLVAERRGIFESFSRSADLTKGHRWAILGLLAIYMVLSWLISAVVAGIAMAAVGLTPAGPPSAYVMIINFVVNTLAAVVAAAGTASIYYELRTIKEGAGADELAAVFD